MHRGMKMFKPLILGYGFFFWNDPFLIEVFWSHGNNSSPGLFKRWIALSTEYTGITIQWIAWFVLLTCIHWITIYPVDSIMQPSDNWGQIYRHWDLPDLVVLGNHIKWIHFTCKLFCFSFSGWKEVFPIGAAQQRNKFQQGFQSDTKYWCDKPTSGKNQARQGRNAARQFTCRELIKAGSNS